MRFEPWCTSLRVSLSFLMCVCTHNVHWAARLKAGKRQALTVRLTGLQGVGQEMDLAPLIAL